MPRPEPSVYPPWGGQGGGQPPRARLGSWVSGNIRRKLTLFVVAIMVMVISLFWFFAVFMLQPAYSASIRAELTAVMNTVAAVLEKAQAEGLPLTATDVKRDGSLTPRLSDEAIALLNNAVNAGTLKLDNRCLDISDAGLRSLLVVDRLETSCVLHPNYETGITVGTDVLVATELNSEYAKLTRGAVLRQGSYYTEEKGQIIMGRTAVNGQYSVVASVNMERIPQAQGVLQRLLLPLSLLLGLFSIAAAWFFSRWFTKPVHRLSAAAREMAKGNYDVRVEGCSDDEIGELARDFNQMAREVKRSAELQRDLIANVSHDLRTPLTLIKGYAETVRDLTGDDAAKRTEQLNVIVDESDRLSALVGSVMELSRIGSGAEKNDPVRFDITQLCDELTYRYDNLCRQKGYTFVFLGDERCDIYADPALVERALHNLLGNALNHVGADGFIGLRVSRTDHGTVRVEIIDHGPGIAEADLSHLFDRYYRARSDAGKQGNGLGLSITKAIFESQHFTYGVESKVGEGSTFWFEAKLLPPRKKPAAGLTTLSGGALKEGLDERPEPPPGKAGGEGGEND